MKRILTALAAMSVASSALAAGPVKESDLPDVFKNEAPYVQNRICGELMVGMARMSADLYSFSRTPGLRDATVMTGTRALVFVRANAALTDEESARAKSIAAQLESQAPKGKPASGTVAFCEERAKRWIKEGVMTPDEVKKTEIDVRAALDAALGAPPPSAPKSPSAQKR